MNEQLYIVIGKVLKGEATAPEEQYLREWLAADMQHRSVFEEMKTLWEQSDNLLESPAFDTETAWQKVAAATGLQAGPPRGKRISLVPYWGKLGFAAAAMLVAGLFIYRFFDPSGMVEAVATTRRLDITLPDQSHIVLREGATLRYPKQFTGHERKVELDGEAFFEITPDPQHPFLVQAQAATVQVLGTSFNVACSKTATLVTVATGKVQMTANLSGQQKMLLLTPGEQGRLKKGALSKDFVSSDSYLYWKTGVLHFREEPFSNVIKELGNMSQLTISFDPSLPAAQRMQAVNISFKDQSVEEMLTDLCLITHCEWSAGNDGYTIRAAN